MLIDKLETMWCCRDFLLLYHSANEPLTQQSGHYHFHCSDSAKDLVITLNCVQEWDETNPDIHVIYIKNNNKITENSEVLHFINLYY